MELGFFKVISILLWRHKSQYERDDVAKVFVVIEKNKITININMKVFFKCHPSLYVYNILTKKFTLKLKN